MKTTAKISFTLACLVLVSLAFALSALFHGYFDPGRFEIKQVQWSSSKQVAMLVERSDQEALGGLTYFVVIGNHLFSPAELRHAYHSNAVTFDAAANCLDIRWESQARLVIRCNGSAVDKNHINAQKQEIDNIAISYENIASK